METETAQSWLKFPSLEYILLNFLKRFNKLLYEINKSHFFCRLWMGKCLVRRLVFLFLLSPEFCWQFLFCISFILTASCWYDCSCSLMRASTACGRQSCSHTAALKSCAVTDMWQNCGAYSKCLNITSWEKDARHIL